MDPRKERLLKSIINHFVESASPVGSKALSQFSGFSPATVRSEMAKLETEGFIFQPHTSAGRVPTESGYRYYIDHLIKDSEFDMDDISDMLDQCDEMNKILKMVSSFSNGATVFCARPGSVRFSGLSETLKKIDFVDQGKTVRFAKVVDNISDFIKSLEFEEMYRVKTYVGQENPYNSAKDFSTIAICLPFKGDPCVLGVVGPTRMPYRKITYLLTKLSKHLSETNFLEGPEEIY